MYQALLLDFYGTLVAEDDAVIAPIVRRIERASKRGSRADEIARDWSREFKAGCASSFGAAFRTQRQVEIASIRAVLERHEAALDADALSQELFDQWCDPEPFADSEVLLRSLSLPVCVVSNIDRADLERATGRLGHAFEHMVTSEDCRAYKPRAEPFEAALAELGCGVDSVLHVGDSLDSDVRGAGRLGIDSAWVNRENRRLPEGFDFTPRFEVGDLSELARALAEETP